MFLLIIFLYSIIKIFRNRIDFNAWLEKITSILPTKDIEEKQKKSSFQQSNLFQIISKIFLIIFIIILSGYSFSIIWLNEIDVNKLLQRLTSSIPIRKPLENPKIDFSIKLDPSDYAENIEIDGIIWKNNYKRYRFSLSNKSKKINLQNLKTYFNFPGIVENVNINSNFNEHYISVSNDESELLLGISGKIVKQTKAYDNTLNINIEKMRPNDYISSNIILSSISRNAKCYFLVSYQFIDSDGKAITKSVQYPIIFEDKNKKSIQIDTLNPNYGKPKGSVRIGFGKEPINIIVTRDTLINKN